MQLTALHSHITFCQLKQCLNPHYIQELNSRSNLVSNLQFRLIFGAKGSQHVNFLTMQTKQIRLFNQTLLSQGTTKQLFLGDFPKQGKCALKKEKRH